MDKKQLLIFGVAGVAVWALASMFGKKKATETAPETKPETDDKKGGENE